MDERREPERIEIELTSHEPTRGPRPTDVGGDGSVTTGVGEPAVGLLETERGRLIAATAFIGVLALLIGVLVGRTGSGGEVATADSAATSTTVRLRTTTTVGRNSETLPTVRVVDTPPPTTPTTGPSGPVEPTKGVVAVAPELADLGVEVIALTLGGDVIRVDPATGSTVTYNVGSSFGPPTVFTGPGWILIPTAQSDGMGVTVLADDGTQTFVDTQGTWPFAMSADGSGRFWVVRGSTITSEGIRMVEISITGEPTGAELALTSYPILIDPLGGFVVNAPGGWYRVTEDGATRLTSGQLIAVGRTRLVAEECDETLECGHFVVDRVTGERRRIELGIARGDESTADGPVFRSSLEFWPQDNSLNEAEDALLVTFWDQFSENPSQRSGVLDLETGEFVEFPDLNFNGDQRLLWAPGGDQVFWLDSLRYLQVFDLATGESVRFSEDLKQLNGFALRPAAPVDY